MERFDIFVTEKDTTKYDMTYYYNKNEDVLIKKRENGIVLRPGERAILKMLNSIK